MDPMPNPDDDDDDVQWFAQQDWGFDIDFRWGSTWLDEQGTAGVAETASSDVSMTNWQSLQEKNSKIDDEIASTAINPHPYENQPQQPPFEPSIASTITNEHSNKKRNPRQRPASIDTATQQQPQPTKRTGKATTARSDRRRSTQQQPISTPTSSSTTPSTSQHPYQRPAHSSRHYQSSRSSLSDAVPNSSAAPHPQPDKQQHHHQPQSDGVPLAGLPATTQPASNNSGVSVEVKIDSPSARVPHKAVEKKYREGIKAMFRRLSAAIPGLPNAPLYHEGGSVDEDGNAIPTFLQHEGGNGTGGSEGAARPPQRPTKAGIISRAIEYINELERDVADERARREAAEGDSERLRAEVRELRRELALWRGTEFFAYGQGDGEGLG